MRPASFCVAAVLLVLWWPFTAMAMGAPIAPTAESGLRSEGTRYFFDFGPVTVVKTPSIRHRFSFVNVSQEPLSVTGLRSSCDCLTVELTSSPSIPVELQPGETLAFDAKINLGGISPGSFARIIFIYTGGQTTPATEIVLTGSVVSGAQFSERVINFGVLAPGASQTRTVETLVNRGVATDLNAVAAYSTVPCITIKRVRTDNISAKWARIVYVLHLSAQSAGELLDGNVELVKNLACGDTEELAQPVQILGRIDEPVHAIPQYLFISSIRHKQLIILLGLDKKLYSNVTVTCMSADLRARLVLDGHNGRLWITQIAVPKPDASLTQVAVVVNPNETVVIPVHLIYST